MTVREELAAYLAEYGTSDAAARAEHIYERFIRPVRVERDDWKIRCKNNRAASATFAADVNRLRAERDELQRRMNLVDDYAAFNRKYGGDETVRGDVAWMLSRIASGECRQIGADQGGAS